MSSPIVPPPRSASALAEAMVQTTTQATVLRRWGIVRAIHTNGTLNVDIAGVIIPNLKRVASYQPTIGERVLIDAVGTDLTVIGATAPSPRAYNRPTGDIEATIRKTPKPDTLFLQGQTIKRADYPNLFAWVQEQGLLTTTQSPNNLFGAGDGSTTFVLPDWRTRTLAGADTAHPLGSKVGVDSFQMGIEQMPDHKHAVSVADHPGHGHAAVTNEYSHQHGTWTSSHGHDHNWAGNHHHWMTSPFYVGQNAHAHVNRPGTASEGPDVGGPGAGIGTQNAGNHLHQWDNHSHSIPTDKHAHAVTVFANAVQAHTVTELFVGGNQQVDLRQPTVYINFLIWV